MSDFRSIATGNVAKRVSASTKASRLSLLRGLSAAVLLGGISTATHAQPAPPRAVDGEAMTLSYDHRQFDGGEMELVVLTAKSTQFVSDTFGAWTPHGAGQTTTGFVLRHRRNPAVFVTLCPFAGPGPGKNPDAWRSYRREVARQLGSETTNEDAGESGIPGGTPSFASWATREAVFVLPSAPSIPARAERHVVASDGIRGVLIMLAGPAADVENIEQDFRFLLARLERR